MVDARLLSSVIIIGGTAVELYLVWNPNLFNNDFLKLLAGIIVALDVLALLKILMNI